MDKVLTFRLDDITPGLKMANLKRFEELFDSFGIRPILGIVPCNEDKGLIVDEIQSDFWDEIRRLKAKGWLIALHGYKHVYVNEAGGILQANPFSEFASLSYEEQKQMISEGKRILEENDLSPKFFMAPGHTFDENTLKALVSNGIFCLTDGYADRPYIREGITFYPCRSSEPVIPSGFDTLCIHLNNWNDEDFTSLEDFLNNNREICKSLDEVRNLFEPVAYNDNIAAQEKRFIRNKALKQRAAQSEHMQRYLKKSYSENKAVKLIKRVLYLPMLLKR